MGYTSTVDGMITIVPPLVWAEIEHSPYLPHLANTNDGGWRDCQYVTTISPAGETPGAIAVEPVDPYGSCKRYYLMEHIQDVINRHPDHDFAGTIDCLGEDGDRWRLTVVDRTVIEQRPTIVWPE